MSIHSAQLEYYSEYGRYGRLQDLAISHELAGGRVADYAITAELTNEGYRITAVSRSSECHTCRSFYSDQTMAIRMSKGSERASSSSPLLGISR